MTHNWGVVPKHHWNALYILTSPLAHVNNMIQHKEILNMLVYKFFLHVGDKMIFLAFKIPVKHFILLSFHGHRVRYL